MIQEEISARTLSTTIYLDMKTAQHQHYKLTGIWARNGVQL